MINKQRSISIFTFVFCYKKAKGPVYVAFSGVSADCKKLNTPLFTLPFSGANTSLSILGYQRSGRFILG